MIGLIGAVGSQHDERRWEIVQNTDLVKRDASWQVAFVSERIEDGPVGGHRSGREDFVHVVGAIF